MKRFLAVLVLAMVAAAAIASDAVEPASCAITNSRTDGVSYAPGQFYRGTTLLLTNCAVQTTGTVVQGLSGVTIDLNWGTAATSHHFSGTAQVTNLGTWWASFTVPTNWEAPYLQVKLTDTSTNVYIYPWRMFSTAAAMQ